MAHIMRLGIWQLKTDADISPITNLVSSWSEEDGIPGTLVSYVDKFATFMLPDSLVEAYNIPADPSWMLRGYTHCMFLVFADEDSRKNYDTHSLHLDLSEFLVPALENGMDSVLSFDVTLPGLWYKKLSNNCNNNDG